MVVRKRLYNIGVSKVEIDVKSGKILVDNNAAASLSDE